MNTKEIGELRRRLRRDRSNMTHIFGCYVNSEKQIVAEFSQSVGIMPENEADKFFSLMRRTMGGTLGKNLVDISFATSTVANSEEHKLLMDLRACALQDEELRLAFYDKVIANLEMQDSYVIFIGCDSYDVPFRSSSGKSKEDADETYTYLLCAICPVKQLKAGLHYVPEDKQFHDGDVGSTVSIPELGFLFPAFDDRSANIYGTLFYNRSAQNSYEGFTSAVFGTPAPEAAAQQKESFVGLFASLDEECSLDVVQAVRDDICQRMELHKESKVPEPLTINKEQVKASLEVCGVSKEHLTKFSEDFDEAFGSDAELHPNNIIDKKRIQIETPDVVIKVAPDRSDLIETRVIDGIKYILINAQEDVTVNGVNIHIGDEKD